MVPLEQERCFVSSPSAMHVVYPALMDCHAPDDLAFSWQSVIANHLQFVFDGYQSRDHNQRIAGAISKTKEKCFIQKIIANGSTNHEINRIDSIAHTH
jgi:hypothetical protein